MNKYADHIQEICNSNGIVIGNHSTGGRAFRKFKVIKIRKVKSSITYAVALHELGHILGKRGSYRLEKEVYAWLWAKENAIEWNNAMENRAVKSLNLYLSWAKNRQHRKNKPIIPPKDHIFWEWC